MNNTLAFIAGLGVGSLVTWISVKEYYKERANEDTESIVERFRLRTVDETSEKKSSQNKVNDPKKVYSELTKNYTKPSITEYASKYVQKDTKEDYDYAATEHPLDEGEELLPYVISPESFVNDEPDFDKITLTYYIDGYVVEGEGNNAQVIENYEEIIGPEALDSFGEYEDDVVYVRNEKYGSDYEILKSELKFLE